MNKKFSTLVGCLALGTAFSAVGQVTTFPIRGAATYDQVTPCETGLTYRSFGTKSAATLGTAVNKIEANKWYQLRVGEDGSQVLIQERNFMTGEVTLRIVDAKDAPLNYSLWQISYSKTDGQNGGKFTFKNKETGLGIVFDHETAYTQEDFANSDSEENLAASILEGCNVEWSWYSSNQTAGAAKVLYAQFHDSDKYIVLKKSSKVAKENYGVNVRGNQVVAVVYTSDEAGDDATNCNALKLTPVEATAVTLNANDINRMIDAQKVGAAGFKFMTPTGIGNREEMNPADNSTLNTNYYVAKEWDLTKTVEAMKAAADEALIEAGRAILVEYNQEEGSVSGQYNQDFNGRDGQGWPDSEKASALVAAGGKFGNDEAAQTAENAKALVEEWAKYLDTYKDLMQWPAPTEENPMTKDEYIEQFSFAEELFNYDVATEAASYIDGDNSMYANFPIRLQETKAEDNITLTGNYLMVDTARWEPAILPGNSPALKLKDAVPTDLTKNVTKNKNLYKDFFFNTRYNYRLTYFPTVDSLLIEPLNASVMANAEATGTWRNSVVAKQFISPNDIHDLELDGLKASNSDLVSKDATNLNEDYKNQGPIALMLNKLNSQDWVVSASATDKNTVGSVWPGTLNTCIELNHSYPTLARTTLLEGVYNIQLATNRQTSGNRVNGAFIVADLGGHVVYDEQERSQEFEHMPATQWVVEYIGCKEKADPVARVKVVNREYATVAFEGQLYKAGKDSVFIINHNDTYNIVLGHGNVKFACSDTLVFTKIDPVNTLGYLNPGDQVIENTFKLKQFFDYGEDPYYLNAVKQGTDTLLRAQTEGSDFELVPVEYSNYWGIGAWSSENIPYGYTSEAAGATQLYKSIYKLKVKDADNINNDRLFVGVNKNGKYCVADTLDGKSSEYTLAYFALKENNHWDGSHYYALIRVDEPSAWPMDKDGNLTQDKDKFARWSYYVYDNDKLAIEQGQLDAKTEDLCESRTEAFILEADTMPYYRRVVGLKNEKFYSTNNENRTLGESVIDGVSYMNIFSIAEEPTRNNEFFLDTAHVSVSSMPTYLLALDVQELETAPCNHEDHPAIGDHYQVIKYRQGRYMIDAAKSEIIPDYLKDKVKPFENVYSRYAFVNAIHYKDTLYIMNSADATIQYDRDLYNHKNVDTALVLKPKAYEGASIAFRLHDQSDDENFYIETSGEQYGYAADGNTWLKEQNQNIVSTGRGVYSETGDHNYDWNSWRQSVYEDIYQALLLNTTAQSGSTANEDIEVSAVKVIAGNGQITINGAAGKKVVVSNILGQVVANTVLTSDNATIAAPQGVVVVAVEGEEAVKAIVK